MMSNLLNFSPPLFSGKTSFNIGSTINLSTVSLNRLNIAKLPQFLIVRFKKNTKFALLFAVVDLKRV